jgi:hypothetical protein
LPEAEVKLDARGRQGRNPEGASAEPVESGQTDQEGGGHRPNEIAKAYDHPIAGKSAGRHSAARPCHHDEIVAGEKLGSTYDHENQTDAEDDAREDARGAPRGRRRACQRCRGEDTSQGDEGAGKDAERQRAERPTRPW